MLVRIAKAGVNVVGLDISPAMLAVADKKLDACRPEVRARVQLKEADMRAFDLGHRFALVMLPYRSLAHILTPKDQLSALRCLARHLADSGRLIFHVFDPNLPLMASHFGPMGSAPKMHCTFTHPDSGRTYVVWDNRTHDLERQLIEQFFIFDELDKTGQVVSRKYNRMTRRYTFRHEMEHLLALCGFEVEALYGDFAGGPYHHGREQVWIARKTGGYPTRAPQLNSAGAPIEQRGCPIP